MLSSELRKIEEDLRSTIKEFGVECATAVFCSGRTETTVGEEGRVFVSDSWWTGAEGVLHSHLRDITFSWQDILVFLESKCRWQEVVTPTKVYYLEKRESFSFMSFEIFLLWLVGPRTFVDDVRANVDADYRHNCISRIAEEFNLQYYEKEVDYPTEK